MNKPNSKTKLDALIEAMQHYRPDWSSGFRYQLRAAVANLAEMLKRMPTLGDLDRNGIDLILRLMKYMTEKNRTPKTVNHYRASIILLWAEAHERKWIKALPPTPRQVRKVKVPRRQPRAWTDEELEKLIGACCMAPTRRGWGPIHWSALILTALETSVRINALMRIPFENFDPDRMLLTTEARFQKNREETIHRLHPETAALVASMPRLGTSPYLFAWPYNRRFLFRRYHTDILDPSGLSNTRHDLFHKLRRSSYTRVFAKFGLIAASEHAGHATDMSRFYLDKLLLDRPNPLEAIPDVMGGLRTKVTVTKRRKSAAT